MLTIQSTENGVTIYYVVRDDASVPRMEVPVRQTILLIVLIILLTAFVTVVWLYRSLIRPLNVLRMATANMKLGNLDFTISGNPDDELGQLCEEFEEMRVRLKEQIDARMKYEQDTVELLTTPFELAGFKDAIMNAMLKGTKREIESEDEKNVVVGQTE